MPGRSRPARRWSSRISARKRAQPFSPPLTREFARATRPDRHRHGRLRRRPQTAAELRYGALQRGWGDARQAKLEATIQRAEVVHTGPDLILVYARLRVACRVAGHALAQREHNADRWIAATAVRLGVPLVSNDGVFRKVPGLTLETLSEP